MSQRMGKLKSAQILYWFVSLLLSLPSLHDFLECKVYYCGIFHLAE